MSNNNLWWSFDPDDNSFSALPAGPMLLPALGIFAVIAVIQAFRESGQSAERILGRSFVNSDYYQSAKKRQNELIQKKINGIKGIGEGLTLAEHTELVDIQHPSWRNGDSWSF